MNTRLIFRTACALAGVLVFTSFGRPAATNQKAPFADKYWILESSTVVPAIDLNMDGKPDNDIRVMLEDCNKDDAEMYKTGGKLMRHNGTKKCDDEEELVEESGTWVYNADTKQITSHHYDTEKPQTVNVKEVSANRMVLTYVFKSAKGNHTITAVLKVK